MCAANGMSPSNGQAGRSFSARPVYGAAIKKAGAAIKSNGQAWPQAAGASAAATWSPGPLVPCKRKATVSLAQATCAAPLLGSYFLSPPIKQEFAI